MFSTMFWVHWFTTCWYRPLPSGVGQKWSGSGWKWSSVISKCPARCAESNDASHLGVWSYLVLGHFLVLSTDNSFRHKFILNTVFYIFSLTIISERKIKLQFTHNAYSFKFQRNILVIDWKIQSNKLYILVQTFIFNSIQIVHIHFVPIYITGFFIIYSSSMDCWTKHTFPNPKPTKFVVARARTSPHSKHPKWIQYADRIYRWLNNCLLAHRSWNKYLEPILRSERSLQLRCSWRPDSECHLENRARGIRLS